MEGQRNFTIEDINDYEMKRYLPVTIVLVLIMIVGIVGNLLVLIIYKKRFKRSSARIYILSLALVDLTVCIIGIPYHVLDLTLILTYTNTMLCKILTYFIGVFTFSSIFILLVVGLDRYLKVCRPLKRQIVDFGDRKACVIAVFVATVISIPNAIIYGQSSVYTGINNITGVECFIDDHYFGSGMAVGYLGLSSLICLVTVVLLIIMYSLMCRKIFLSDNADEISLTSRQRVCCCCSIENVEDDDSENDADESVNMLTELNKVNANSGTLSNYKSNASDSLRKSKTFHRRETMIRHSRKQGTKTKEKNTRKITLMMMTITLVFIIAYLPFLVISIMDSLDETLWDDLSDTKAFFLDFLLRLYLLNNTANPIIYSFWDDRFRKAAFVILRNIFCRCMSINRDNKATDGTNYWSRGSSKLTTVYTCNSQA